MILKILLASMKMFVCACVCVSALPFSETQGTGCSQVQIAQCTFLKTVSVKIVVVAQNS